MKKIIIVLLVLTASVSLAVNARAADFRYSTGQDGSVNIAANDSPKDLHVVANTVNVATSVSGDLLAAGNNVTVNGDVDNSSFLVGNTVSSIGKVGHHLRIAGNTVTVSGTINGDLFVAGNTVTIDSKAIINGSAYLAGNKVTVSGTIKGALQVVTADLVVDGTVGSVNAQATTFEIKSGAVIQGDLIYKSPQTATIDSQAKIGGKTTYTKINSSTAPDFSGLATLTSVLSLLGVAILLAAIGLFWPKSSRLVIDKFTTRSLQMFLIGLLLLVVGPMTLLMLMFTVVGAPGALLVGVFWLLAIMLGSLFAQLFVGSWLVNKLTKESELTVDWQSAAVGVLVFAVLGFIPLIGPLIIFALTMTGFGAVVTSFLKTERSNA